MLEVSIPIDNATIKGDLVLVPDAECLVVFAHGSGSSRFSSRNRFVAELLNKATISTLLFDLLTEKEDRVDQITAQLRFDIPLLAERLVLVTNWLKNNKTTSHLNLGYFGASTGAAAALIAAAKLPEQIKAVVSRGGRPDLAEHYLPKVKAPTLLVVGSLDTEVIQLNEIAYDQLQCIKELFIIPGATHLFEETGTLENVAHVAINWFKKYATK